MTTCPTCGRENPPDSRFCNSCGATLAATPAAREERKVVTVLFCDLVGFTSRAESLDPEDVRAVLTSYHERLRRELERHGGTVEKFIGDAVMALFGAPVAHEDDPERAVRAALAIRDELTGAEDGLHVRIGITTGEALVNLAARPEAGEAMAAGDVVNTAARLQTAAPVDAILVDETTHRATARAIVYEPCDPVEAKGKAEPVPAWAASEARARLGSDVAPTWQTPLVGRADEVDALRDVLARARRNCAVQLVTLVGVPGIGKSRLVHELFRAVEDDPELIAWRQGRSLPYGEEASYWALAEMVKAEAGILGTDPDDTAAAKLREAVAALVPDAGDARWVERHLRPLAGLGREEAAGDSGRDEAFAAWRRFLEALAESGPTVLVFEDLHWADDGLLDFVDHVVDWATGIPLVVVCTARPELLARRPGWGGGKASSTTLSLGPLSDEDTARLVAALLDRQVMPAELQAALLMRAGGNPLYAEEFVRMAAERGATALAELPLPQTVQGIIAARLDGLAAQDKALLQAAAVVGKVFWLGAVAAIAGHERAEAERRLHELERRQLVRRERRSSVGGEVEYAFWHLVVRDVAYGQIPRAQRALQHQGAAEWIAGLAPDRVEDRAGLVAHHYVSALELARAAGREAAELEEPARAALRAAGERAFALNSFPAAVGFFERALALWPEDDPERAHILLALGEAQFAEELAGEDSLVAARAAFAAAGDVDNAASAEGIIGELAWAQGRAQEALAHARRAAEMLSDRPPSQLKAFVLSNLSRALMLGASDEDAIRVGREALAMAQAFDDDEVQANALNTIGTARANLGDRAGLADLERSIEVGERIASAVAVRGYINLGSTTAGFGDVRRAAELHERGLELAQRFGQATGIRFLTAERASDAHLLGDWDEAERVLDAFIAAVEAGSPYYMEGPCRAIRAGISLARDDVAAAVRDSERAIELGREIGEPQALLPALAAGACVFAETGRIEQATRLLDELLASGAAGNQLSLWVIPAVMPLEGLGRADELIEVAEPFAGRTPWIDSALLFARGRFSEAAALLHEIGALPGEAFAHLRAAEALLGDGRRPESDVELARATAFYSSMRATRYLRRAETLLAASA